MPGPLVAVVQREHNISAVFILHRLFHAVYDLHDLHLNRPRAVLVVVVIPVLADDHVDGVRLVSIDDVDIQQLLVFHICNQEGVFRRPRADSRVVVPDVLRGNRVRMVGRQRPQLCLCARSKRLARLINVCCGGLFAINHQLNLCLASLGAFRPVDSLSPLERHLDICRPLGIVRGITGNCRRESNCISRGAAHICIPSAKRIPLRRRGCGR